MILITGGLGFIGLHTARSLLDLDESCVLTRYRVTRQPDFLAGEIGKRIFIEQLDVTDAGAFAALGKKYQITGIVHLASPDNEPPDPYGDLRMNTRGLFNALRAANDWGVRRLSVASSAAVYAGVRTVPLTEDASLFMTPEHSTETFEKVDELLTTYVSRRAGFEAIALRIAGIYGPLNHSPNTLASRLVHVAVDGEGPDSTPPRRGQAYGEDGGDICYVRDCGRGIALLMLADHLEHRVYNVGAGRATTNAELLAAVREAVPEFEFEFEPGHDPHGPGTNNHLDLSRITADTGYLPEYDVERAIAEYVGWLRAGNAE